MVRRGGIPHHGRYCPARPAGRAGRRPHRLSRLRRFPQFRGLWPDRTGRVDGQLPDLFGALPADRADGTSSTARRPLNPSPAPGTAVRHRRRTGRGPAMPPASFHRDGGAAAAALQDPDRARRPGAGNPWPARRQLVRETRQPLAIRRNRWPAATAALLSRGDGQPPLVDHGRAYLAQRQKRGELDRAPPAAAKEPTGCGGCRAHRTTRPAGFWRRIGNCAGRQSRTHRPGPTPVPESGTGRKWNGGRQRPAGRLRVGP